MIKLPNITQKISNGFDLIFAKKIDKTIRNLTGTMPINKFSQDDIFIVGYPKSGNTWIQNIVTGIVYGLNLDQTSDSLVQDLVPDVHYKNYYRRYRTPMLFKSHHLPKPEYRRVVYLIRDGRDVMVSYFNHLKALEDGDINFMEMIHSGNQLYPCKWHNHINDWIANPYDAEMILIRYENIYNNPVKELQKLSMFIGVEIDELSLEKIVRSSSFEKMRDKEIKWGWDNSQWPRDEFFTRRGKIGSYKDEMPPEILAAFLKDAGDTLKRLEYSVLLQK